MHGTGCGQGGPLPVQGVHFAALDFAIVATSVPHARARRDITVPVGTPGHLGDLPVRETLNIA